MKELKNKIMTLKYCRVFFGAFCFCGIITFLVVCACDNVAQFNILGAGSISIIIMLFGMLGIKYCNNKISVYMIQYMNFKNRKQTTATIIEFKNIA